MNILNPFFRRGPAQRLRWGAPRPSHATELHAPSRSTELHRVTHYHITTKLNKWMTCANSRSSIALEVQVRRRLRRVRRLRFAPLPTIFEGTEKSVDTACCRSKNLTRTRRSHKDERSISSAAVAVKQRKNRTTVLSAVDIYMVDIKNRHCLFALPAELRVR